MAGVVNNVVWVTDLKPCDSFHCWRNSIRLNQTRLTGSVAAMVPIMTLKI